TELDAELQLDRLKQKLSRRVLLLQGHQASWHRTLTLSPGMSPQCHNLTAYLRDKADFKDKLSPVVTSLSLVLAMPPGDTGLGLVLYGDTLVQAQVGPGADVLGTAATGLPHRTLPPHCPQSLPRTDPCPQSLPAMSPCGDVPTVPAP
ncbi:ITA2B protein, partial [Penelope pileata]|nr:ITA2B protein [Penelope pileata]